MSEIFGAGVFQIEVRHFERRCIGRPGRIGCLSDRLSGSPMSCTKVPPHKAFLSLSDGLLPFPLPFPFLSSSLLCRPLFFGLLRVGRKPVFNIPIRF